MVRRFPFLKTLRIVTTLLAILILLFAMTTSTRVPLHQRVLVQGIGVDRTDSGQFHVTVQAVSTSASTSVEVYETDGDSVFDALNNITLVSGKTPFYTHNSILILGRQCAESGLTDVMDFFVRHHQTRPAENVFLAKDKAGDILTLKSDPQITMNNQQLQTNQYVLASQIEQLASAGDLNSQLLEVQVMDVANDLYSESCDVFLPVLSIEEKQIAVRGCAVFSGDKLKAILSGNDTVLIKAVQDQLTGGAVQISLDDGTKATLSFLHSNCETKASLRDNVPHFDLTLSCEMNIDEIARPMAEKQSIRDFEALQKAADKKIRSVLSQSLDTLLYKEKVDVLCLSKTLLHQQTDWWKQNEKQWHEILPHCTYSVTVNSTITAEGQEMSPQTIEPFSTGKA
ncbi:MAG: Ger(x)C family spore germination protein [Oscillospiraceae bacterium]|nr:Ger(x)C family spore germination protein [Oscillospiraceae bacterium]